MFHDFDWFKNNQCFAVDQIWAMYDDIDGMPRYYARIMKVYSPGFKVRITPLVPELDYQDEIDWICGCFSVACGKFMPLTTEYVDNLGFFSHRMVAWEKYSSSGSLRIYPRKGETWALFKNWDIKWRSDRDNHSKYKYELVEILSGYTEDSGIQVAYLIKIRGFESLFKPTINNGTDSFQIPSNELLRFSHRVPSVRTTGRERRDVPEGWFYLDPGSLPANPNKILDPIDVNGSSISPAQERSLKPKKRKTPDGNNTLVECKLRYVKPVDKTLCGSNPKFAVRSCAPSTFGRGSAFTCQSDVSEMGSAGIGTNPDCVADQNPSSVSQLDPCEIRGAEFYNFENDKAHEKFKSGQIWALYCELDHLPKYYAQIDRVELSPYFKLCINWLEACAPSKGVIQWLDKKMPICCGMFTSGKMLEFYDTNSFSHQLTGVSDCKENKYEIYPRKGEVWALNRNFTSDLRCSDLQKCEFDMVEVLEVYHARWILVLVLEQVLGFKTVFKAKRNAGHDFVIGIPWTELFRFSHHVPSFRLTEARYGSLRGCWELDLKSIPVRLFSSNEVEV